MRYIGSILFVSILFASCKKDHTYVQTTACNWPANQFAADTVSDSIQNCVSIYGNTIVPAGQYSYTQPTFNPTNSNEFCFMRTTNQTQQNSVFLYNLCLGTVTHVTDNVFGDIHWSKKNWLAFCGGDGNIWKVKPTGDSLTELTHRGNSCYWPYWNADGTQIAFFESTSAGYEYVIDENGNYLDTISGSLGKVIGWRGRDLCLVTSPSGGHIQFSDYNLETKQFLVLGTFSNVFPNFGTDQFTYATLYNYSDTVIWSCVHSIQMADLKSGSVLASHVVGLVPKWYDQTFDAGNGKIIISRSNYWIINQYCYTAERIDLYIMNLDGSNIHVVVFSE